MIERIAIMIDGLGRSNDSKYDVNLLVFHSDSDNGQVNNVVIHLDDHYLRLALDVACLKYNRIRKLFLSADNRTFLRLFNREMASCDWNIFGKEINL